MATYVSVFSGNRVSGSYGSFQVLLNKSVSFTKANLISAQIPSLWNNCCNALYNASIAFTETSGSVVLTAKIAAGNYTATTLIAAWAAAFTAASTHSYTYTCTLDPLLNVLTITSTGLFKIRIDQMTAQGGQYTMLQLGFDNTSNVFATSQVATGQLNVSNSVPLHIVINELPNRVVTDLANGSGGSFCLYVDANTGDVNNFTVANNYSGEVVAPQSQGITRLTVSLQDQLGRFIPIQTDWSFYLRLE